MQLFADAVAIEVGVGAVALLAVILGAAILAGFAVLGAVLRGPIARLSLVVDEQSRLIGRTNTLIQISMARQGPTFPEN